MTWGSNRTFLKMPCPYCGREMVDDRDQWPTTHMEQYLDRFPWHDPWAPWWRNALKYLRVLLRGRHD